MNKIDLKKASLEELEKERDRIDKELDEDIKPKTTNLDLGNYPEDFGGNFDRNKDAYLKEIIAEIRTRNGKK